MLANLLGADLDVSYRVLVLSSSGRLGSSIRIAKDSVPDSEIF